MLEAELVEVMKYRCIGSKERSMLKRLCYGLQRGTTDAREKSPGCLGAKRSESEKVARVPLVDSDSPGNQSIGVALEEVEGRVFGDRSLTLKMISNPGVRLRRTVKTLASRVVMVGVT